MPSRIGAGQGRAASIRLLSSFPPSRWPDPFGGFGLKLGAKQVQEHTAQAGGFTDIRYRGLIVELKVEKENGDRAHLAQKYTRQPAQYAGVEARQVSVLLVLDLTEKTNPPGSTLNDISLVDAATHGASGGHLKFPSKAFMFVVNGNTKNPSSYSR